MHLKFIHVLAGTSEERGLRKWRDLDVNTSCTQDAKTDVYSLHFIQKYFDKVTVFKYIPFCPSFSLQQNNSSNQKVDSGTDPLDMSKKGVEKAAVVSESTAL